VTVKRIAIFCHGGVAQPGSTQTVPAVAGLIGRLSEDFDISVYIPVKADGHDAPFRVGAANVSFVHARHDDSSAHIAMRMTGAFLRDHRKRPFAALHGFWALPGGITAVAAGRVSGIPSIVSILGGEAADLPGIGYGNMAGTLSRVATLWTCRNATALAALTQFQVERLRAFGFNRSGGIHVIPFGADLSFFFPGSRKPHSPPYNLLHVADINRVKDQLTMLKALQLINARADCRLRFVGRDTLSGSLQQQAWAMGLARHVTFAGFVPHDEILQHYAWAHVLVHSSLYEGEGVVFAEAAASGVPISGTRVGLLADEGDSIAMTAEPGDEGALARNVLAILSDSRLRENLRARAQAWSSAHDACWTAAMYGRLYGELT